jgi:LuxR family maltose regulon positive regulatory protein
MRAALLESKYRIPGRRPNAVARHRLDERLNAALRSPLTVLSAPAGFGKTTVLTEWLATFPPAAPAVAWLSLDERDNDATLFWTYVITAIGRAVKDVGGPALGLLDSSPPATEAALAALLNDLGALPEELLLVLDDYHLIDAPDVHEGMAFLLEHQPPQLHVILATRADPPLPLPRMRARGQLSEVRATDLRFTVEESLAYLNSEMGLRLSEGDVAALDARTEGWIAALQLAALSMQGRDDVSVFIAGFAGDDRYIVDFLGEEVLARQPADVREFLLCTSILERLTGPLCDAVTGRSGGKGTLVALERANLFVVPLDDRRQWYRYHHLFGDVLRAHLLDEQPERVADLHARASAWFEANADSSQAVSHALAGGDPDRAADLMEIAVLRMLRDRREGELARWVRVLPDDVVRKRPVLGIGFVAALAQVSDFTSVGRRLSDIESSLPLDDGGRPLLPPPPDLVVVDREAYLSLPAKIHLYRAALNLAGGDLEGTVAQAREAMSLAPPDDALTRASASALGGLASLTAGELSRAHAAYTRTVAELTSVGFLADVLGCCITLGDIRRTQGQLGDARSTYQRALDLTAPQAGADPLRGTADMHVGIAGVLLERDDLQAAGEHLDISRRLGDHLGLPQNPYRWRVAMARLREAQGALDDALELLDEAGGVYVGDYNPNVRPVPAVRARLRLRRGELDEAEAWARERHLSTDDQLSYLHEYEHVTLTRILLARHRRDRDGRALEDALGLLERLLVAAQDGERGGSVLEVRILQALAYQGHDDMHAAVDALQHAVRLAQPEGYVRLFAEEGAPMAALLKALPKQATAPGYLRRLLAATTRTEHRPARGPSLVEPLSVRELDVLRLLGTDLDGPDIARALSVSLSTVRTHTRSIYTKLGVTSRRAAVRRAHDLHLLPGPRRG